MIAQTCGRDVRAARAVHLRQPDRADGRAPRSCAPRPTPASMACWFSTCPVEEAEPFRSALVDARIDPIFLLSPTTTEARIRRSAELGRGFLYVISRLGVTGVRDQHGRRRARRSCSASGGVAAAAGDGFGISTPDQVAQVAPLGRRGGRRQRAGQRDCGARRLRRFAGTRRGYARWLKRSGMSGDLDDLRRRIDLLDEHLVRLLNARARVRAGDRAAEAGARDRQSISLRARSKCSRTWGSVNTGPLGHAGGAAAVRANHRRSPAPGAACRAKPQLRSRRAAR